MKRIVIIFMMAALFLTSCGKEAVKPEEPAAQMTEQDSEPESSTEVQSKVEGMAVRSEEPVKSSGEPDSHETTPEPKKPDADITHTAAPKSDEAVTPEKTVQTSKPAADTPKPSPKAAGESTSKPAVTATPVTPAAESTPASHISCTWDGGSVTTAAGCSSQGVKTFTCTVCGNTRTESIAAVGHTYTTESKAATCTESGYTKTYCTVCGDVQSETTQNATGHTMEEIWFTEPTCLTVSTGHCNKCVNCGYVEDLPEYALGHVKDGGHVFYEPTCTHTGKMEYNCARCGCVLPDETTIIPINPDNHDWGIDPWDGVENCAECGARR